jgi:hypothetical protein
MNSYSAADCRSLMNISDFTISSITTECYRLAKEGHCQCKFDVKDYLYIRSIDHLDEIVGILQNIGYTVDCKRAQAWLIDHGGSNPTSFGNSDETMFMVSWAD